MDSFSLLAMFTWASGLIERKEALVGLLSGSFVEVVDYLLHSLQCSLGLQDAVSGN